jgi:AcrR family transcriptional regulator
MARPRQFDEERVLRAIREQFWDAGYAATSLEDLMRVSGLGKGSLYAAPRALDALRAFVMAPVSDPDGAAARRGCLMANSTCELATADPEVQAEARRTYETTTALVAECVVRARSEGDVTPDTDPIETARALLAAQQGLVFMGRTGLDIDKLTATARSLAVQLLPGT